MTRLKLNDTKRLMNICDPIYKPIHDEMMMIARNASTWILDYFVQSYDVVISGNFENLVKGWNVDPCDKRYEENNQEEVVLEEEVVKDNERTEEEVSKF